MIILTHGMSDLIRTEETPFKNSGLKDAIPLLSVDDNGVTPGLLMLEKLLL